MDNAENQINKKLEGNENNDSNYMNILLTEENGNRHIMSRATCVIDKDELHAGIICHMLPLL